MYGIICAHTTNKCLAEEIFLKLFIRLKQEEVLLKFEGLLCVSVLRYTYINARQELKIREIKYTLSPIEAKPILPIFCSQSITIKQIACKLKISKKEVKQYLHKELLALRSKTQDTYPLPQQEAYKEHGLTSQ